ncbi:hypothetical protein [Paenibacillus sinopodophylli]|uniref:hypothetical protein n=1 Tax=Paenibacillus sinopodophylli TaxID=1837342 RepID=UPI00110CA6F9|nr:hypothetical protein [Paenibacillus sinopodophylli]
MLSAITTSVLGLTVSFNADYVEKTSNGIVLALFVILFLQLCSAVFFSSEKRAFKYQKLHLVIVCVTLIKFSLDGYFMYFIVNDAKNLPDSNIAIGIVTLVGGFVFLAAATVLKTRSLNKAASAIKIEKEKNERNPEWVYAFIKCFCYIAFIIILWKIAKKFGYSPEGYPLVILYHAFIIQVYIALKWSEVFNATISKLKNEFDLLKPKPSHLAHETDFVPKETKWYFLILIKMIQYFCLFFIGFLGTKITFEPLNGFNFTLYVTLLYLLLKWISQYPISYNGMYFINGILSGIGVCFLLLFISFVIGTYTVDFSMGMLQLFISMISMVYVWCFNFIYLLRKHQIQGRRRWLE